MKPPPPDALINQLIALSLGLLIFAGTLGLSAVWVRQAISGTANRSRTLEVKIANVERRLDEVGAEVAAALNPDSLLRQNQAMRIGLVSPRELQIVRVNESPELLLASKRNREVFSLASASGGPTTFRLVTASLR